jgi:hypothetical protein
MEFSLNNLIATVALGAALLIVYQCTLTLSFLRVGG